MPTFEHFQTTDAAPYYDLLDSEFKYCTLTPCCHFTRLPSIPSLLKNPIFTVFGHKFERTKWYLINYRYYIYCFLHSKKLTQTPVFVRFFYFIYNIYICIFLESEHFSIEEYIVRVRKRE